MSIFRQGDSLNWLSFFSIPEKEKKQTLDQIPKIELEYDGAQFAEALLYTTNLRSHDFRAYETAVQIACEYVALKFMIKDTHLAKDILSSEDFGKAQAVFARKQYNSKILRHLLSCFFKLLKAYGSEHRLENLFTLPILDQIKIAWEDEVNRSFGTLRKTVDKVASGVKSTCYFHANQHFCYSDALSEPLNDYVRENFGYDFNQAKFHQTRYSSTLIATQADKAENHFLCLAMVDDAEFWKNHDDFSIITFVNEVAEQNDTRHAEKILEHIFKNLRRMKHMDLVFKNGFPLYMSMYDELKTALEDQCRRFTFKRLDGYCDLSALDDVCFCYPMSKVDEARFEIGRSLWERFISEYNYPHDKEKVMQFIADELEGFVSENIRNKTEIGVILDCGPFRFTDKEDDDRKLFRAYHPDCFTAENIWKRVYLKAHAVTLLSDDEKTQFSYLQRIFIDLIKTVEQRLGICTAHQLDLSTRAKHYDKLKKALRAFGIDTDDRYKEDYIVSLLDRDTAMASETEWFAELEQLGDAIYGLAVAELLFYNPQTCLPWNTEKKISALFEDYTRAEAQVAISKKHGFDSLFLHIGLPAKYLESDSLFFDYENLQEEHLQVLNKEKYLADSLEMIIGAVCKDKGYETAIRFAKELLKQTFTDKFSSEVKLTEENEHNVDIERDYWARILPAPCTVMEEEHRMLWGALDKVIMTCSLDTDDKNKRKYITGSFGNTAIYGKNFKNHEISFIFYDYLQNGLDFVLRKYGEKVRENFKNHFRY